MDNWETAQRGDHELIVKANLKRARKIAIMYGVVSGFALICLVYGYVQRGIVEEQKKVIAKNTRIADSLKFKLAECAIEGKKALVTEAMRLRMMNEETFKKNSKK